MKWATLTLALFCAACAHKSAIAPHLPHIVRRADTWTLADWQARPFETRVATATGAMIDYLRAENKAAGINEKPQHAYPDAGMLQDITAALSDLPGPVVNMAQPHLIGVFLIRGLGSTAYAETIVDADEQIRGGWIALDIDRINRRGNDWASYRELSPFAATTPSSLEVTATIAAAGDDNRQAAIQYIVLHELAHIIAAGRTDIHPRWDQATPSKIAAKNYPFSALNWTVNDGKYVRKNDDFNGQEIRYYARDDGGGLAESDALALYRALAQSNFPSLYASQSPFEDFAESFASYVHSELLGKPWQIRVSQGGATAIQLKSCWKEPRCQAKRQVLEALLAHHQHGTANH